jgi:cytidine deaminase
MASLGSFVAFAVSSATTYAYASQRKARTARPPTSLPCCGPAASCAHAGAAVSAGGHEQGGDDPWTHATAEDLHYVSKVSALAQRTPRPIHSDFLVAACVVYCYRDGGLQHILGVNSETAVIGASICAERCAFLQLRLRPDWPGEAGRVKAVYITTSADEPISPGLLCREFMQEVGGAETRIVMFTAAWAQRQGPTAGDAQIGVHRLGALFPYPCMYHRVHRQRVRQVAAEFAARMDAFAPGNFDAAGLTLPGSAAGASEALARLYEAVREAAAAEVPQDQLYPIHYAAGVLFSDGRSLVARQDKGLEYGTTVDAAAKLIAAVEAAVGAGAGPVALLYTDQFGVLHAPTAKGRAYFREYGFPDVAVYVHEAGSGRIARTDVRSLVPLSPEIVCSPVVR